MKKNRLIRQLQDYVNSSEFITILEYPGVKIEKIEIVDCFFHDSLILIGTLIHSVIEFSPTTNYSEFIIKKCKLNFELIEGKFLISNSDIMLTKYEADLKFINNELFVEFSGIFINPENLPKVIFRINRGVKFTEFVTEYTNTFLYESDILKNCYILDLRNESMKYKTFRFSCKYKGYPVLRFGNKLSVNKSYIWGESFLFPYLNYMPIGKSIYTIHIHHPRGTVVVGGSSIFECNDFICSELVSNKPLPLPFISWGNYNVNSFMANDGKVKISIYSVDPRDELLKIQIIGILNKFVLLYGDIPYDKLNVVIDSEFKISCTQGNVIIISKRDSYDVLAHEFAHIWWGSCVTMYGKGSSWFHEGMADLSSHLYFNKKIDDIINKSHINKKIKLEDLMYNDVFGCKDILYYQGLVLLCYLIKDTGIEEFFNRCKCFISKYKYSNVTLEQTECLFNCEIFNMYNKIIKESGKWKI